MPYQTPSASDFIRYRRLQALVTDKKFDDDKSKAAGVLRSNHGGYYAELASLNVLPSNFLLSNKFPQTESGGGGGGGGGAGCNSTCDPIVLTLDDGVGSPGCIVSTYDDNGTSYWISSIFSVEIPEDGTYTLALSDTTGTCAVFYWNKDCTNDGDMLGSGLSDQLNGTATINLVVADNPNLIVLRFNEGDKGPDPVVGDTFTLSLTTPQSGGGGDPGDGGGGDPT